MAGWSSFLAGAEREWKAAERLTRAARFADPDAKHIRLAVPVTVPHGTAYLMDSPRCGTCRHPSRDVAEAAVVAGKSFRLAAILASEATEGVALLTERQIRHHTRSGHYPAPLAAFLEFRYFAKERIAARLG